MTKKLFLIIGAPGSGKTTDAAIIAERNSNFAHYSTGDLLRAEVASGSERGLKINHFISRGLIVPIEIAIETITSAIKSSSSNIILFDGYPRSFEQMHELDIFLKNDNSIELVSVIEVVVSEEIAHTRVLGRSRGEDDKEEIFNNRMRVYTDPLAIIQVFYEEKNLLQKINGERSIEIIVDEIESFIKSKI